MAQQQASLGCLLVIWVHFLQIRAVEERFLLTRKTGKLKSAYKAGERVERGYYCPLTILSIATKVYEVLISNQLDIQVDLIRHRNQWAYKKEISMESLGVEKRDK